MKRALIVSLVVSIPIAVVLTILGYTLVRDVDALLNRAEVAADCEDMIQYLTQLKENMKRHGMTSGHFALIFKTPTNNLALHFKTINRVLERLNSIKNIPKNEVAYQVALEDIRETLRELPNPALKFLWVKYWFLFVLGGGIWLWPVSIHLLGDWKHWK